ncbi:hypothetical protein [Herbidospora sp. NBRC 101105]|uniref:hypothetical protein n=1 Tax=Herbidospora sp. NBRC 101105 TaxID=3032195 RepID=UPI002553AA41|nr:hypothetical protein [Herbidospora sp. NBRC 101105]
MVVRANRERSRGQTVVVATLIGWAEHHRGPQSATAAPDAVLVFDGVFLMRPELIDRWDLRVLVSAEHHRPQRQTPGAVLGDPTLT